MTVRCLILVLCAAIAGCTQLFFFPMKQEVRTPADIGLVYEDVYFPGKDEHKLHGWYLPAVGHARATVLFLHGNAENISTHIGSVYWLPARGFNVLLFDYQGYGQSEGTPSVAGALDDVEAALGFLVQHSEHYGEPVIVLRAESGRGPGHRGGRSQRLPRRISRVSSWIAHLPTIG